MPHNKVLSPGAKFGPFTFQRYTQSKFGNAYGIFRCGFCGEERERVVSQVRTGYISTCHCQVGAMRTKHGHAKSGKETGTYQAWSAMKKRCSNPDHPSYQDYGGRGISVCERWLSFENFLADMGEKPTGLSLDRENNDADYTPGNCRWATMRTQNNNKRSNTLLTLNGITHSIATWSEITSIKDCTISERLRNGWSVERTLTTKTRRYGSSRLASS